MIHRSIQLADVPLRDLIPVKITIKWIADQDHSRWVFRAARNGDPDGLFFKIWNPTYLRRDNILRAIEAGFYDDCTTPALEALVFHGGLCRGYVMKRGRLNRRLDAEFFELVKNRTQQTGYFHVHFSACHTMRCEDRISLLDLEAVYPLAEYPRISHYHSVFDDADYERHVARLYGEAFPDERLPRATTERGAENYGKRTGVERHARSLLGKFQSLPARGWRQLRIGAGNLRPRIDLIAR